MQWRNTYAMWLIDTERWCKTYARWTTLSNWNALKKHAPHWCRHMCSNSGTWAASLKVHISCGNSHNHSRLFEDALIHLLNCKGCLHCCQRSCRGICCPCRGRAWTKQLCICVRTSHNFPVDLWVHWDFVNTSLVFIEMDASLVPPMAITGTPIISFVVP